MKGLTIVKRTSKKEGSIRLRFRLRDGRGVDLYHKSEIDADLKDLDKFTDAGELKPRVSIYNKQLKLDIDTEIDAIEAAYRQLCETKDKTRITADDFEKAISFVLHPQKNVKALTAIFFVKLLQLGILWCKSATSGSVYNENHFACIFLEGNVTAFPVFHGVIVNCLHVYYLKLQVSSNSGFQLHHAV